LCHHDGISRRGHNHADDNKRKQINAYRAH
jgi:hypothetical protein